MLSWMNAKLFWFKTYAEYFLKYVQLAEYFRPELPHWENNQQLCKCHWVDNTFDRYMDTSAALKLVAMVKCEINNGIV